MKRGPNKWYKLALVAAALLLFGAAAVFQRALNQQRADPALHLTRVAPLENAPPMLAFTTVALGSFRGLIANALWIRAQELQLDEKYFEMVQLADWITKLQPHIAQVWVMQAWNMSYNISVKFSAPEDRWRWVQRGIQLLRDEGLKYNPGEPLIYRELAWHFQHKIGQALDDAHVFYKTEWAHEMQAILGGGRPSFDVLIQPRTDEDRKHAATLRERYKLDPGVMKRVDQEYGPLDWRLPEAHAIYWTVLGMQKARTSDLLILRRVIYQSLQQSVFRGRIVLERADGSYLFGPDLTKISVAFDGYEKMIAEEKERPEAIKTAERNFLREAIYLLYTHNRLRDAEHWMAVLRDKYPTALKPNETLDEFAIRRLAENITQMNQNQTRAVLDGLLRQYFFFLSIDETDHANGLYRMAQWIWRYYADRIRGQEARIGLPPLPEMAALVREEMLNPQNRILSEQQILRLRTLLNLAAPATTNAPALPPSGINATPR